MRYPLPIAALSACFALTTAGVTFAQDQVHEQQAPSNGQPKTASSEASTDNILVEIPIPKNVDYPKLLSILRQRNMRATIEPRHDGASVWLRGPASAVEFLSGRVREFFQTVVPEKIDTTAGFVRLGLSADEMLRLLQKIRKDSSVQVSLLPNENEGIFLVEFRGLPDDLKGMPDEVNKAIGIRSGEEKERRRLAEMESNTVSIQFPGGTVEAYVNAVLAKFDLAPPIYADDAIRSLHVAPVELRRADLLSALRVLSRAFPTNAEDIAVPLAITFGESPMAYSPTDPSSIREAVSRSVIVIGRASPDLSASSGVRRAAFVLGPSPIERARLDPALDAVALAVNWNGASPTFRAKFHAPSNVLILQGTPDELALAAQIVKGTFPDAHVDMTAAPAATASPTPIEEPSAKAPPTPRQPATSR
jgi:hypothetical protein